MESARVISKAFKNLLSTVKGAIMSTFSSDDLVNYKGKAYPRETLYGKVRGLGWTAAQFKTLSDEQVRKVMDEKLTPDRTPVDEAEQAIVAKVGAAAVTQPTRKIDLENLGEEPSIMGTAAPADPDEGPIPTSNARPMPTLASGVRLAGVVDPTKPQTVQPSPFQPQATAQPLPTMPIAAAPNAVNVRPPRSDVDKLMAILDASFQLASSPATKGSARALINAHGLERAFQALHPSLAQEVLGRVDTSPDKKRRGGIILDIEDESKDGYIHIITTGGVITLVGNLSIRENS